MDQINDYQQYNMLVKEIKKSCPQIFTNCYLFKNAIERIIEQGRFYYERVNGGIVFLSDEQLYYQTYYYLTPGNDLRLAPKTKPVLVQNTYTNKSEALMNFELSLRASGFRLADTLDHYKADPETSLEKLQAVTRYVKKNLKDAGFRIVPLTPELLPSVKAMQLEIPEIPYYQIVYLTDEEVLERAEDGGFPCIVDKNGDLCAAFCLRGNKGFGWLAVKNEYKAKYGMAPVLTEVSMEHAITHHYQPVAWIVSTNTRSKQYHHRVGFEKTGRSMDEWLLEPEAETEKAP